MKTNKSTPIKQLPTRERPREKFVEQGGENLSDGELLAILLGSGQKGQDVLSLARSLLARFGNLRQLSLSTLSELRQVPGIGVVKAVEIKACLEIARRFQQVALFPGESVCSSKKVFEHFHELLRDQKKERFYSLLLDSKHCIIKKDLVSVGTLNLSIVHPREVFVTAIREAASHILLVHNHPSGDPTPSPEDIQVTKRLARVGQLIGIEVIDHVIIGCGTYISFVEEGLI